MMKKRFKIIDYVIAVFMAVSTVLLVALVTGTGWGMFAAMIVGMFLGMAVMIVSLLLFSGITTPFELFATGMITTMFTGMGTGMAIISSAPETGIMVSSAITFALIVQFGIDLYDMKLKGDVLVEK
ncbi:hypothetical protein H8E50_06150 [bacterium]|nr:hypothetical protein [bacterium]